MPNTQPPIAKVRGESSETAWSLERYRGELIEAGAERFEEVIVPLYLTRETTPEMIKEGAESGLLRACKYYPPHGTTNSEHGVPMDQWIGGEVFRAIEDHGVVLCIHGEQHALEGPDYFDAAQTAESTFYTETMPKLLGAHPRLRIVCEHITTAAAAEFVSQAPDTVAATITPQHLLYTVAHLVQGLRYHLYCLPLVKFERDRRALREAILAKGQSKFFAGTDSAPHTNKVTDCGCAAGCYTGGCAPQLYAMAFEAAGADLGSEEGAAAFRRFLCDNGPAFYGFASSQETFTLRKEATAQAFTARPHETVVSLPEGMGLSLDWSIDPDSLG